jgi:hypothetical protein
MELFYVFNNWENHPLGSGIFFKPEDATVQDQMLRYWTNFARSGDPNGDDLVQWPQYQAETDCYMEISATPIGTQCGLKTAESDLWDEVTGFEGCTSSLGIPAKSTYNRLLIYPNPVIARLHLAIDANQNTRIEIFDSSGRPIANFKNQTTIDVSDWPAGIYFITVVNNGRVSVGKFLKVNDFYIIQTFLKF